MGDARRSQHRRAAPGSRIPPRAEAGGGRADRRPRGRPLSPHPHLPDVAPRWYVPRHDVYGAAFEPVQRQTFCPYKRLCSSYDIAAARRAAWSYVDPYLLRKPRTPSKPDPPRTTDAGAPPARRNLGAGGTFRLEPPRLRTTSDPKEERHATWFELFFDLVFVAAVSQLGAALARDPSGAVFARFAALFVVIFWAWILYTLYANRFDTDDLIFRLGKSGGMLAIAAIAVNLPRLMAGHGGGSRLPPATSFSARSSSRCTAAPGTTFTAKPGPFLTHTSSVIRLRPGSGWCRSSCPVHFVMCSGAWQW